MDKVECASCFVSTVSIQILQATTPISFVLVIPAAKKNQISSVLPVDTTEIKDELMWIEASHWLPGTYSKLSMADLGRMEAKDLAGGNK